MLSQDRLIVPQGGSFLTLRQALEAERTRLRAKADAEALAARDEESFAIVRADLKLFAREAWKIVEPQTPLIWNWHLDCYAEHLAAVTKGEIKSLLINVPPGCSKSLFTCVMWPAWEWANDPAIRWMFVTYDQKLATRDAMKTRLILESDWFKRIAPHFSIRADQNEKTYFETMATGARLSTSVNGHITGQHPDRIVVDDPHNAKQIESELERQAVLTMWDQSLSTRGVSRGARRVVIMQRLRQGDLSDHVLAEGGFVHICLPMRHEPKRMITTPIGWNDPRTFEGELLSPQQFPEASVRQMELSLRAYGAAGQLQQRPSPAGGGYFKREWFCYFREEGEWYVLAGVAGDRRFIRGDCWIFQTVDLALSEKETACYTSIATWAVTPQHDLLLLEMIRVRMEAPEAEAALEQAKAKWSPKFQAIEHAHYGIAICQAWLRKGYPIRMLKADKDKLTRSMTAQIMMENRKVFHLAGAVWLTAYENELLVFNKGQYDDQVDTFSYAAMQVSQGTPLPGTFKPVDLGAANKRGQILRAG